MTYIIENLQTKNFKATDFFKSKTGDKHKINNLEEFLKQPNHQEMLLNGIHLANRMQKPEWRDHLRMHSRCRYLPDTARHALLR
jgi:hypothetical protein